MRRADREIKERLEIEQILAQADVCRIALNADPAPYIVPLNFGYEWNDQLRFYFHCASVGRKLELLKVNPHVGVEVDIAHVLLTAESACDWGMKYKSVIGTGVITSLETEKEKVHALDLIMAHYKFPGQPSYSEGMLRAVRVLCLEVTDFSSKAR